MASAEENIDRFESEDENDDGRDDPRADIIQRYMNIVAYIIEKCCLIEEKRYRRWKREPLRGPWWTPEPEYRFENYDILKRFEIADHAGKYLPREIIEKMIKDFNIVVIEARRSLKDKRRMVACELKNNKFGRTSDELTRFIIHYIIHRC